MNKILTFIQLIVGVIGLLSPFIVEGFLDECDNQENLIIKLLVILIIELIVIFLQLAK